jgi:hypothetical protein
MVSSVEGKIIPSVEITKRRAGAERAHTNTRLAQGEPSPAISRGSSMLKMDDSFAGCGDRSKSHS